MCKMAEVIFTGDHPAKGYPNITQLITANQTCAHPVKLDYIMSPASFLSLGIGCCCYSDNPDESRILLKHLIIIIINKLQPEF